jgi:REP element-mobilizing transposase RayT
MANTYAQLYPQLVFAVKHRQVLILPEIKTRIEQYICGIAANCDCKPLAIYCNPDHTHLFVSMKPKISCSEAMQIIKSSSSLFINQNNLTETHFEWQTGFGAFSYSKSQTDAVCQYIWNQKKHHEQVSFKDEYLTILQKAGVDYDDRYLFDWL